ERDSNGKQRPASLRDLETVACLARKPSLCRQDGDRSKAHLPRLLDASLANVPMDLPCSALLPFSSAGLRISGQSLHAAKTPSLREPRGTEIVSRPNPSRAVERLPIQYRGFVPTARGATGGRLRFCRFGL